MKKVIPILISAVLFGGGEILAQQDPHYSQFFLNRLNYNPAVAGAEGKICALGIFRAQWLGFGSADAGSSPTTMLASINTPIGEKQNFGVGLNIVRDQLGFENSINPMLSGAYIKNFESGNKLSFGLGVGLMQKSMAGDKLKPLDQGDPKIPTSAVSGMAFDMNTGIYFQMPTLWRFDNFYIGGSATHLTQGNVNYETFADNPMVLHYYGMTGAQYNFSPSFALEPNIIVKRDKANTSADINAMAMYNNRFRLGITYRTGDAFIALAGLKLTQDMQIGYSFDLTTSNIQKYSAGSHEIAFKYCFLPPKIRTKPKPEPNPRLTPRFL